MTPHTTPGPIIGAAGPPVSDDWRRSWRQTLGPLRALPSLASVAFGLELLS